MTYMIFGLGQKVMSEIIVYLDFYEAVSTVRRDIVQCH